ncbi:MAG: cytochrome c-type biogenesis protein CcmH [Planctomycetes bacterium]|nr:cytochrome c-type biogenesis protein CcmH [Planctomycetota bacterium]
MNTAQWLFALVCLMPATLAAGGGARTPEAADRIYHEVGDQLFCICGCREKLLTCSHNVCAQKTAQRQYLRELSQNDVYDASAMKQEMVKRFGPKVLQVPEDSNIYAVLAIGLGALATAFGGMFWYIVGRNRAQAEAATAAPAAAVPDELEQRIERDMQELE